MEKYAGALTALGGFTGLGVLIDLGMYAGEREKFKKRLEDWWLRFSYVNWSNFGREEAQAAIEILDRWAGAHLWSWKRWKFAALTCLLVFVLVLAWTAVRFHINVDSTLWSVVLLDDPWSLLVAFFTTQASLIVGFAVSLSATRKIASVVALLSRNTFATILAFVSLLVLHALLLIYWSAFIIVLLFLPLGLVAILASALGMLESSIGFDNVYETLGREIQAAMPVGSGWLPLPNWIPLVSFEHPRSVDTTTLTTIVSFKITMDLVANGIRILFALVFVGSFIFRPLVQEPITRLWYGAMNSTKPFFTMLFGGIGALVGAWTVLLN